MIYNYLISSLLCLFPFSKGKNIKHPNILALNIGWDIRHPFQRSVSNDEEKLFSS